MIFPPFFFLLKWINCILPQASLKVHLLFSGPVWLCKPLSMEKDHKCIFFLLIIPLIKHFMNGFILIINSSRTISIYKASLRFDMLTVSFFFYWPQRKHLLIFVQFVTDNGVTSLAYLWNTTPACLNTSTPCVNSNAVPCRTARSY